MSENQSTSYFEDTVLSKKIYTLMVSVEFIVYVLTTIISPYFFIRLRKISLLHANLRVILCNIPILFILMVVHRFHFLIQYIIIYVLKENSLVTLSFQRCLSLRFFYDWGIFILAFAIPTFTFERFLATLKPKKYERTASPKMGFSLTICLYALSFGYAATFLIIDWNSSEAWHNSFGRLCCGLMYTQPGVFLCLALSCYVFYLACIPLLVILYKFNMKKVRQYGLQQLNVRYQYCENVAAIRSIVPSVVCYGCVLNINVTVIVLQHIQKTNSTSTMEMFEKIWLLEQVVNVLVALYTLCYLSMFFVTYAPLQRVFWRDFDWLRVHRRAQIGDSSGNCPEDHKATTEAYFAQFHSQWN